MRCWPRCCRPQISPGSDRGVRGLLGQDFLSAFNYTLDYRRRRLTWDEPLTCDAPGAVPMNAAVEGRFVLVADADRGTRVRLVPDSGAEVAVLFRGRDPRPRRSEFRVAGVTLYDVPVAGGSRRSERRRAAASARICGGVVRGRRVMRRRTLNPADARPSSAGSCARQDWSCERRRRDSTRLPACAGRRVRAGARGRQTNGNDRPALHRFERIEQREPGGRPVHHRHCDRAIQLDHRVAGQAREQLVERGDLPPVGCVRTLGLVVDGGDGRLQLVRSHRPFG